MPTGEPDPLGCYDLAGANVVQRVKDAAFGILGPGVVVTPVWDSAENNGRTGEIKVTSEFTYSTLAPIPFPQITITAESRLVINN